MSLSPQLAADLAQALDNALAIDNEIRKLQDQVSDYGSQMASLCLKRQIPFMEESDVREIARSMIATAIPLLDLVQQGKL